MNLAAYPRPAADTGIGFHYAPRRTAGDAAEAALWLPVLRTLGASWLVIRSGLDDPVPEAFVRQLVESGIEPVVLMPVRPIRAIDPAAVRPVARAWADAGVHYLAVMHQPNRLAEWSPDQWAQPDLVGRFLALWLPVAWEVAQAGLIPVFPALAPGGEYWDTAFLGGALQQLARGEARSLLDRLAIGVQNLFANHPIDWGQGGAAQWRDARPYRAVEGLQDHRGLWLPQWYDEIVRREAGFSLPLVALASGAVLGNRDDPRYGVVDLAAHAERNAAAARMMLAGELPDVLLNLAFWTLTGGGTAPGEDAAWFRQDGQHLPAADLLRQLPRQQRVSGAARAMELRLAHRSRVIGHYVLFGTQDDRLARAEWDAAQPYLRHFRPTAGFSTEEACQAESVTIVGSAGSVPAATERLLREAGCHVERVDGPPRELGRRLRRLVDADCRFPSELIRRQPRPAKG